MRLAPNRGDERLRLRRFPPCWPNDLSKTGSEKPEGTTMRLTLILAMAAGLGGIASAADAADDIAITIKDHRFDPAALNLPAGQKVTLSVTNQDATPEEFESDDLDVEKVIAGGQSATIQIGPLDAGSYEFHGEYHEDTAKGTIVVK